MLRQFIEWLIKLLQVKLDTLPKEEPKTEIKPSVPPISHIPWYDIALKEVGTKETAGDVDSKRVLEYQKATTLMATDDETPWCSSFVCWCLEKAGYKSTNSSWAKSYLKYGTEMTTPKQGCIAVLTRGPKNGHVAFYVGHNENGTVSLLGGNQSNSVCIKSYPASMILGYRWPVK
jgi:uncharacterized protein (TIGR02594 family)